MSISSVQKLDEIAWLNQVGHGQTTDSRPGTGWDLFLQQVLRASTMESVSQAV